MSTSRQSWFPPVSAQPTSEELARHLRLIYTALNQHDEAIVTLNGKTTTPPQTQATGVIGTGQKVVLPIPKKRLKIP